MTHSLQENTPHWHARGYLPHFESNEVVQHVTFRLFDAVPAKVLAQWKEELSLTDEEAQLSSDNERVLELARRIEQYEDAGRGNCWLLKPGIATIVQGSLLHFDDERYRLLDWCIMPNHVHVLVNTCGSWELSDILHSWKSWTAKECNKALRRRGTFWMKEYFDRYVRGEEHFRYLVDYIENNPVKAGLVGRPEQWRFSGCAYRRDGRDK